MRDVFPILEIIFLFGTTHPLFTVQTSIPDMALLWRSARWAAPLLGRVSPHPAVPVRGKRKKARAQGGAPDGDNADAIDLDAVDASMGKVVQSLERSLSRLRASGASADMLDGAFHAPVQRAVR